MGSVDVTFQGIDAASWANVAQLQFVDNVAGDVATLNLTGTALLDAVALITHVCGPEASFIISEGVAVAVQTALNLTNITGLSCFAARIVLPVGATLPDMQTDGIIVVHRAPYVWVVARDVAAARKHLAEGVGEGKVVPFGSRFLRFAENEAVRGGGAVVVLQAPEKERPVGPLSSLLPWEQAPQMSLVVAKSLLTADVGRSLEGEGVRHRVAIFYTPAVHCNSCIAKIARFLKKDLGFEPKKQFAYDYAAKNLFVVLPDGREEETKAAITNWLNNVADPALPHEEGVRTVRVLEVANSSTVALLTMKSLRQFGCVATHTTGSTTTLHFDHHTSEDACAAVTTYLTQHGASPHITERVETLPCPAELTITVAEEETLFESMRDPSFINSTLRTDAGHDDVPDDNDFSEPSDEHFDESATMYTTLLVGGMTCGSCAVAIEEKFLDTDVLVHSAVVNSSTGLAKVHHHISLDPQRLVDSILEMETFTVSLIDDGDTEALRMSMSNDGVLNRLKWAAFISLLVSVPMMVLMMVLSRIDAVKRVLMHHVWRGVTVSPILQFVFCTPVVLVYGRPFFTKALASLSNRTFTMDVLVSLGVVAAYVSSLISLGDAIIEGAKVGNPDYKFHTASSLIAFMLLGRYLESRTKGRTTEALLSLMKLQPKKALLLDSYVEGSCAEDIPTAPAVEVEVKCITQGQYVKVLAGSSVPVDGEVCSGSMSVDESMITGEAIPVLKGMGCKVAGGTTCVDGVAVVKATEIGANSCLAQILNLVNNAQLSKAPVQKYADNISAVFVPCVVVLAAVTFTTWMILGYADLYPCEWRGDSSVFTFAAEFLIASLVVACPCAMGLATPTAVVVSTGIGAKNGIFIKGGDSMEVAHKVKVVVFDKTGTLSTGKLTVAACEVFTTQPAREARMLQYIGQVEEASTHPVAMALCRDIEARTSSTQPQGVNMSSHHTVPGLGVAAGFANGVQVKAGNRRFITMTEANGDTMRFPRALPADLLERITFFEARGMSVIIAEVVYPDVEGAHYAIFSVADKPKKEAKSVIRHLHAKGYEVFMVTGDATAAANHFAGEVGLPAENVFSEIKPAGKAAIIRSIKNGTLHRDLESVCSPTSLEFEMTAINDSAPLQEKEEEGETIVAFVGDGINDAPALSIADVGIALGAGTSVAVDAADCVLTRSDLKDVATFLSLAKVTMNRIRMNFVWAFGYNILGLPIAAGVFYPAIQHQLPPTFGGVAMICSSIFVLFSSLLLNTFKPPKINEDE